MADTYTLTIEDTANPSDADFVRQKLAEFNRQHVADDHYQPLHIFLRTDDQAIVAGLLGATYWGWLHVDILWIDEIIRRLGYGRQLLNTAEQEAIWRGCRHAHLDTMDFQAREFYEKQGYVVFGELTDLPTGHSRYFMKKALLRHPYSDAEKHKTQNISI
jgi:GNAT superfamily N-acetyltransferase